MTIGVNTTRQGYHWNVYGAGYCVRAPYEILVCAKRNAKPSEYIVWQVLVDTGVDLIIMDDIDIIRDRARESTVGFSEKAVMPWRVRMQTDSLFLAVSKTQSFIHQPTRYKAILP